MRYLKSIFLATFCALMLGCSEDDKLAVIVEELVSSGAILRTLSTSGELDMFDTESVVTYVIQEQDEEEGGLLDRVEVTVRFVDNNGTDNSVASSALATLPGAEFGATEGLPSYEYSVTFQELLDATGVAITDVLPGDTFVIDMELFLTDGRTFKNEDASGGVIGGSFFRSPYRYSETIDDGITFEVENVNANEVSLTNPNEEYSAVITIDDANNQDLVETLNVYRAFVDRSIVDDIDLAEPEELFATFNIADLGTNEDGASTLDYQISLADLFGPNLTFDDLGPNDEFQLRYEIVTADGRIVTTSGNETEYYRVVFVTQCIQLNADAPYPGEYTINFFDSFGDGWDGAFISVSIDGGTPTDYTLEGGENGSSNFTVPEGSTTLLLTYTAGNFENEHTFTILDPNGNSAASGGPFIPEEEIVLLVCE